MTKDIDFIFDFASPNAYLVHRVIPEFEARTGATFNYIPCLLGGIFKATGNQAPMLAFGNIKNKNKYDGIEIERFIAKHDITQFKMNPHFPVNTLLLIRGLCAAEDMGCKDQYIEAGLVAMWELGEKMDDPETYAKAMTAAGLNGEKLLEETQNPDVKTKLMANTEAAVERGAFGVPTFFVGDEIFFGKERLGQIEELIS